MSIEELVNRAYTSWTLDAGTKWSDHMRAALTEQAETHAIELRAYEATVENLNQRIRDLQLELLANGEARRVPLGILEATINLVEGLPAIDWRNSKTGMRLKDASAWAEFYCAAKDAIDAAAPKKEGE